MKYDFEYRASRVVDDWTPIIFVISVAVFGLLYVLRDYIF